MARLGTALGAIAAFAGLLAPLAAAAEEPTGGLLPVPAATIERGERITAAMLTEKHFFYDPARPLAVITDPSAAIGKAARRRLPEGKPIPANAFTDAKLVVRGKPTEARFRMGGLTITATVMPLDDGGAGDFIQARNLDSGRTVTGVVAMDGVIEMSAP